VKMWRGLDNFRPWREEKEEKKRELAKEIRERRLRMKQIKRQLKDLRNKKFRGRMSGLEATIRRVNIEGLGHTKDHIVTDRVKDFFKVETFQDIIQTTKRVDGELKSLGCFKTVNIVVDTVNNHENDTSYEVNIKVEELGRFFANFGVIAGKQENEVSLVGRGGLNNLQGGGERLELNTSRGSESSSESNVSLYAPIHSLPKGSGVFISGSKSSFSLPGLPLKQTDRGFWLGSEVKYSSTSLLSRLGLSYLQTKPDWQNLTEANRTRWHPGLESAGDKLLGSISNILSLNMLDSDLLPDYGLRASISHTVGLIPWSGLLAFQQIKLGFSSFLPLMKSISLGCSGHFSHTTQHCHTDHLDKIPMSFLVGCRSPMVFRGTETPEDYTGDMTAAVYKISLTSKLPLLQQNSLLCKHTRFHTFITGHTHRNDEAVKFSMKQFRHFFGLGFIGKVSDIGRFEINYTVPLDSTTCKPKLSFAFGTEFL